MLDRLGLNALLLVVWLLVTTYLYRAIPGTLGILLSALWPTPLLLVPLALAWVLNRRDRRRLLDEEFRED